MTLFPSLFITGIPRSGTTMLAEACARAGASFGITTRYGSRETYENFDVGAALERESSGLCWHWRDDRGIEPSTARQVLGRALRASLAPGFTPSGMYACKHAALLMAWAYVTRACPDAKWIIVRRDPEQLVQSCMQTGYMRAHTTAMGWRKWIHDREVVLDRLCGFLGDRVHVVYPHTYFMTGSLSAIERAVQWAGLTWTPEIASQLSFVKGNDHAPRNR